MLRALAHSEFPGAKAASLWRAPSPSFCGLKFACDSNHIGLGNCGCIGRRLPAFASSWFNYWTTSAKTSFKQDNAVAVPWQNRSKYWRTHAPCPRGRTHLREPCMGSGKISRFVTASRCANFACSWLVSGQETVSIPMPFLSKENRGDGPERSIINGRQLA